MNNDPYAPHVSVSEETVGRSTLQSALTKALNKFSAENDSNTPDFILAKYLLKCLEAWNEGVMLREVWYGRNPEPGTGITTMIGPVHIHTEEAPLPSNPLNFGARCDCGNHRGSSGDCECPACGSTSSIPQIG